MLRNTDCLGVVHGLKFKKKSGHVSFALTGKVLLQSGGTERRTDLR
jgi:hypothetical protein